MLRFHFTADDLARIRLAPTADPLWELLLSVHLIARPAGDLVFGRWRRLTMARLGPAARPVFDLAPPRGYSADFLTPADGTRDLDTGVDAVLSTPRRILRADVAQLAGPRHPWRYRLAGGDAAALRTLGTVLRTYFAAALAPYWARIQRHVDTDRVARARTLLDGGVEQLLARLHPDTIRWRPPVLEVAYGSYERDVHLDGRGLLLVPAFFCWHRPLTLRAPDRSPVLVYPIRHEHNWTDPETPPAYQRLPALLGTTRAAVVESVAAGVTGLSTSQLAERVGISLPSTSQHTTVLRQAGLITTRQDGRGVLHAITPLGLALLNGEPHTPTPT